MPKYSYYYLCIYITLVLNIKLQELEDFKSGIYLHSTLL